MNIGDRAQIVTYILRYKYQAVIAELNAGACDFGLPSAEGDAKTWRGQVTAYEDVITDLLSLLETTYEGAPEPDLILIDVRNSLATMKTDSDLDIPDDLKARMN